MFSKQALPKLDEEPDASRRFRANVKDLFLTNQLSAERTSSLLGDAAAAGVEALEDVKNLQGKAGKNCAQRLDEKICQKSKAMARFVLVQSGCMGPEKTKSQERMDCSALAPRMAL